jgi:hypothetical protein
MSNNPREKLKLILSDPKLYIESFVKIVDKRGRLVPFKLNNMQLNIKNNAKKYNIILKSRQGGGSVYILAKALYLCMTKPNTHCMMLSHNLESTRNIFNKAKQLYDSIPDVVKPKLIKNNRNELGFTNGSLISCATLGKKDNSRGATLTLIHVSELAFVGEQARTQLLALEQALIPNGEIYIESTANGVGNYYYESWNKAVAKQNSYSPMFFNYLDSMEMFIDDHNQALEIFKNLNNREFTERDLTDDERELMESDSRFTLGVILWRRYKINNSSMDEFNQEFPLTPEMAFSTTGASIFDTSKIHERIKHIPQALSKGQLGEFPIELTNYINRGLSVYSLPEKGKRYSLGVDGAEGVGRDYSTVTVLDVESGVEVAHYRDNNIAPHKFTLIVYELLVFYNRGLAVIEKKSAGITVLDNLRHQYNYSNIYKSKQFDERGRTKKKIGFVSSDKSRPILINSFREAYDKGEILVNSKAVLQEMLTFIANENGKIEHIKGGNDDSLFSFMLALFGTTQPFYV